MDDTLFFRELAIHLTREGFTVQKEEDGLLPVELDGAPLCRISKKGAIRFKQEEQDAVRESLIRGKVSDIVRTVSEYTRLMDPAPYLKAAGLSEKYKLLADFNGTVLAAQETRFGAQFATWDWNDARTALSHGNYYPQNYEGAKRDFAVRSGLVDKQRLLSDEQLTEIYRCIHETLDSGYPITAQREKLLRDTAEQIEWAVPDLEERVDHSNRQELDAAEGISPIFKINEHPGRMARENGAARYPDDFPHLEEGKDFAAWNTGGEWNIETILPPKEIRKKMEQLLQEESSEMGPMGMTQQF